MPNQGNKSNGNSGIVKPKKDTTKASTKKQGTEQGNAQKGDSGSTGGSKKASGGKG